MSKQVFNSVKKSIEVDIVDSTFAVLYAGDDEYRLMDEFLFEVLEYKDGVPVVTEIAEVSSIEEAKDVIADLYGDIA